MGALAVVVSKKQENVIPVIFSMLEELKHRGTDGHGIATPNIVTKKGSLEELKSNNVVSSIALGHNCSQILPRDFSQPIQGSDFTYVFEGRMFPSPNRPDLSDSKDFLSRLGFNPIKNAKNMINKLGGSYAFAIAKPNKVIVGRDVFGTIPLYYGENDSFYSVASERKALWKLGIKNVKSFPPGNLAIISKQNFSFQKIKQLKKPPKEKISMETAARALELLLFESTRKYLSDLDSVAIAFSGGLDSSVVALLAKSIGLDVQLISVGLKDQPDVIFSKKAAKALDLPLLLQIYDTSSLEESLSKVLWLIEEPNVINACIAIPFLWLAETASNLGFPILLAGQGADELFGGYQKYLTIFDNLGSDAVEQQMFYDVENSYENNFQRDNQVSSYYNIELRFPFIDTSVIDFALRLPLRFKINSPQDKMRKIILRNVAKNLGIPTLIADKPKKAIQYTTGVTKALKYVAKNKDLTLKDYVTKSFNNLFN